MLFLSLLAVDQDGKDRELKKNTILTESLSVHGYDHRPTLTLRSLAKASGVMACSKIA
jgi:hypothetical protein